MRLPALLLLLAASSLLTAPGAWAQQTQPSIPRSADGKPDFSGIWQTLSAAEYDLEPHSTRKDAPPGPGIVEGQVIPYRPEASQQRKKNFDARATNDPRTKCFTLGTPRGIYSPEPFQIFQRARDLTLVFQFGHSVRTIHTNETRHPKGPIGFWLGDSRARWEGDTLVVDVVDFNGETWLDRAGNFHSASLKVTERYSLIDRDHMQYEATLEDPETYTRPWVIRFPLYRNIDPNARLGQFKCVEFVEELMYGHLRKTPNQ